MVSGSCGGLGYVTLGRDPRRQPTDGFRQETNLRHAAADILDGTHDFPSLSVNTLHNALVPIPVNKIIIYCWTAIAAPAKGDTAA